MELVLQRYSWAVGVLGAIIGAYLAARTINTFAASAIAPKPSLTQQAGGAAQPQTMTAHVDLDADMVAKLFNVPLPKPPPPDAAPVVQQGPVWNPIPVRTSLRGSLIGTAVADPAQYSLCEIMNPDLGEPQIFTVGSMYLGARIYQIDKERVLFVNNGVNEYMDNGSAGPNLGVVPVAPPPAATDGSVKQLSEHQFVVAKSEINNALTNLSDLATKARIVPSFKNGVANGFKLFSIVPDSLYSKIGIQNGDVIHRINGYEMNSPDKALEIYQKLRDANRIEIEFERRGETVHNSYSIE
jgi:general secretion pathway protein C